MKHEDYQSVPANIQLAEALEAIMQDWNDATAATVYHGKPGKFDIAIRRLANARRALSAAALASAGGE